MHVYKAISEVSADLAKEGIGKDRSNQQQGYKFRGIDDCLNALAPLLAKHGLIIYPEVVEREVVERQTKNGGALFYVTVKVKYTFGTIYGDHCAVITYGEAMDSADKATNKAMSAAYKYAVIQTFCIPTEGDNDADATTHDVAAARAKNQNAIKSMKQPVAHAVARGTVANQKSGESDTHVSDETWAAFIEWLSDDPDRMDIGTQIKGIYKIPVVSDLKDDGGRVTFIREFQQACKDAGLPCEQWVK